MISSCLKLENQVQEKKQVKPIPSSTENSRFVFEQKTVLLWPFIFMPEKHKVLSIISEIIDVL